MKVLNQFLLVVLGALAAANVDAQPTDRQIAAQFAPVFYQGLGENPRSDYIAKFDFDGDLRGDNNWVNAADKKYPLLAYVYYAVSQTKTHYFIHYAVFHPRDYKGGEVRGRLLSDLLRQGAGIVGDRDPTGLLGEATSAHENDMEGALVVAAKNGVGLETARVEYVQTLSHNRFLPYVRAGSAQNAATFTADGANLVLYIEPRGHGIQAHVLDEAIAKVNDTLIYRFTGKAEDPEIKKESSVGYDLLPIQTTLWPLARSHVKKKGLKYGSVHTYAPVNISVESAAGRVQTKTINIGRLGSAFLGAVGGRNMARPPWGWFDMNRREDPLGLWFFDPARVIKRDFDLGESFSTVYTKLPFWAAK